MAKLHKDGVFKDFTNTGFWTRFLRGGKVALTAALFVLALVPSAAHAQPSHSSGGPFGLGIILGEPNGISFEYKFAHTAAVDGGLAYSLGSYMILYADYLVRFPAGFGHSTPFVAQLTPYLGVGGVLGAATYGPYGAARFGVRVPVGLEWAPSHPSIGVFAELVPGLAFMPATGAMIMGGVGIRYFF